MLVCLDMEGVLTPEIWIAVADKTGIAALRRTTRDEPDYDRLMRGRLELLDRHAIRLPEIQAVIETLAPLDGATEFLDWLRERVPVIILSDTFDQFAAPLMRKLGFPTLFCHRLEVGPDGAITGYRLRQKDAKTAAVRALKTLNFEIAAVGDSFNDTGMFAVADRAVFFRPSRETAARFPQYPSTETYPELKSILSEFIAAPE